MTGKKADYFWAFMVGGFISVIAELVFLLLLMGGVIYSSAVIWMLAIIALLGMIAAYFGIYDKLKIGGFGAILPFCGLTSSIVQEVARSLMHGKSMRKAAWAGLKAATLVFAVGIPFAFVLAFIIHLA